MNRIRNILAITTCARHNAQTYEGCWNLSLDLVGPVAICGKRARAAGYFPPDEQPKIHNTNHGYRGQGKK